MSLEENMHVFCCSVCMCTFWSYLMHVVERWNINIVKSSEVKPLCMPLRHMVQWRYSSTYS